MKSIDHLVSVMARLRDPKNGCPWDIEQTFASIAPHTIEEAYEVADAIDRKSMPDLKEELGDLLLQVAFHAQMAAEIGAFTFDEVAAGLADKLVRRHPHVFADEAASTADDVSVIWENVKDAERAAKGEPDRAPSVLDGIASNLPALTRALKIQKRMARTGFDWKNPADILDKVQEELDEMRAEIASGDTAALKAEYGDVMFVMTRLGMHLGIEPEAALRDANAKVERRFRFVEQGVAAQGEPATLPLMEGLWQQAKAVVG